MPVAEAVLLVICPDTVCALARIASSQRQLEKPAYAFAWDANASVDVAHALGFAGF
jgi:hypothetical protein